MPNFNQPVFWDPSKLLTMSKTKYIWEISKSGINSKEIKFSSDFKLYYSLDPKTYNWTPRSVWTGKLAKFWHIDGTYKDGLQKYFLTQKTHIPYIIPIYFFSFPYRPLSVFNLHRDVEWVGSFFKNFQKGVGGNHLKSQWFFVLFL